MKFTNDNMQEQKISGGNFKFTHVDTSTLGAPEYTLVGLVVDASGSVMPYAVALEAMIKEIVKACRRSPRADNLQLRLITFNRSVQEVHGFKPLPTCNENDYVGALKPYGTTALFDATYSMAKALAQYGEDLQKQDFSVNAAMFVLTDGQDNDSTVTAGMVKQALDEARSQERLESIMPVLIGVGAGSDADAGLDQYLQAFKDEAGFQQYVALDKADEKNLAKLAQFISKSISSQSSALGTGGASQNMTF
jgi:uncharacterized protein YegL